MRALIKCPKCEKQGTTSILGELKPTGHFIIQRIYQYQSGKFHKKFTIIGGSDFFVICDLCGETVYFKTIERRDYGTMLNYGITWVRREGARGTVGTNEVSSGTN